MIWCVSFRLRAFGTVSLLHETRCKMGQPGAINARVRATKSHQNFSKQNFWQKILPIYTIGSQTHVLVRFFPFECILDRFATARNLVQKRQTGAINANVHARCRARIFRNERSRSTALVPKLMFWCVSFRLGAFGTVSLLHETCCKTHQTGTTNAKVRATMSC